MKISKKSNYIGEKYFDKEQHLLNTDRDLNNIVLCLQGRIRLTSGVSGTVGENIYGECQTFTSSATATATNAISHTLNSVPVGWIIIGQDKVGNLYSNGHTATNTTITLVSTVTSTNYSIFLLK